MLFAPKSLGSEAGSRGEDEPSWTLRAVRDTLEVPRHSMACR